MITADPYVAAVNARVLQRGGWGYEAQVGSLTAYVGEVVDRGGSGFLGEFLDSGDTVCFCVTLTRLERATSAVVHDFAAETAAFAATCANRAAEVLWTWFHMVALAGVVAEQVDENAIAVSSANPNAFELNAKPVLVDLSTGAVHTASGPQTFRTEVTGARGCWSRRWTSSQPSHQVPSFFPSPSAVTALPPRPQERTPPIH